MKVEVRVLGGFGLALDGDAGGSIRIRSRKGCALLAYLAMQPQRRASRERLADLLWGNQFDDRARQNLRQSLVGLRTDLGNAGADVLVLDQDAVRLCDDRVTIDALHFAELANSADPDHQQQAVAFYRGEFLADFKLNAEGFEDWARSERGRLAAIAARLFATVAARADQLGMCDAAVNAAERLIAIDPLREDWQRLALRIYARHRGRNAALAHARAVTAQLKDELGVAPDTATTALIEEIKREAIGLASEELPPATSNAPQEPGSTEQAPAQPARGTEGAPADAAIITAQSIARPSRWMVARFRVRLAWPMTAFATVAAVALIGMLVLRLFPGPGTVAGPVAGAAIDSAALAAKGLYSIAVLPFTANAGDAGQERALAEQITDDLINDLSRAGSLQVISRPTSDLYRDRPIDVAAAGTALGARYVVVGSVHREAARVRINVELVDASTRVQVWTNRIERDRPELPAATDEIAWGIARQLHVGITMAEDRRTPSRSSRDREIGELLAKGWAVIFRHNVTATTVAADDYFTEVLQRDPENLSATIGLAAHYVISVSNLYVRDSEPYLSRAEQLLGKAIDKNPRAAQAYYFLGILQKTRNQPEAAFHSFTTALELSPSNAPASAQIGSVLASLGRADEAMEHVRHAMRLSPQDPALGRWEMFGGQIEIELGHDEAAIEWLSRAITLNPRNIRAHAFLGAAYALSANAVAAAGQALEVKRLAPWAINQSDKLFLGFSGNGADGQAPRYLQGWQMAVVAASRAALP